LREALARRKLAAVVAAAGLAVVSGAGVAYSASALRPRPTTAVPPSIKHRNSEPGVLSDAGGEAGIEILVHNLSHADLLVTLSGAGASGGESRRARPLFNQYNFVSKAIVRHLDAMQAAGAKLRPIEATGSSDKSYPVGISLCCDEMDEGAAIGSSGEGAQGGGMEGAAIATPWERFHLKGVKRHDRRPGSFKRLREFSSGQEPPMSEEVEAPLEEPRIDAAVLPLVAMLLPEWVRDICINTYIYIYLYLYLFL